MGECKKLPFFVYSFLSIAPRPRRSLNSILHYEALATNLSGLGQQYVRSGELPASTAYEISTIKDEKRQSELADFVVDNCWNPRAVLDCDLLRSLEGL